MRIRKWQPDNNVMFIYEMFQCTILSNQSKNDMVNLKILESHQFL